jgi:hypothetical protein
MSCLDLRQRVLVTGLSSRGNPALSAGLELLSKHGLSQFRIVGTPGEADIVLYVENGYHGLIELPALLKCVQAVPKAMHFVFSECDWPYPVLPGAYTSLSRSYPWAHSWSFLSGARTERTNEVKSDREEPEFLFSFLGRVATHPIRKKIQMLNRLNTPCLDIEDAPKRFPAFDYSKTYIDLITRSKFVLCPRGFGVSSIRTFEVMSLRRAPVIISDHWQRPPGIPWEEFCVVIREDDVASIPARLGRLEDNATSMGQRARQIYERYFAPNVFFDRLLATLLSNFGNCTFTRDAILWRAWRALGWRELRTVGHRARSRAFASLSSM